MVSGNDDPLDFHRDGASCFRGFRTHSRSWVGSENLGARAVTRWNLQLQWRQEASGFTNRICYKILACAYVAKSVFSPNRRRNSAVPNTPTTLDSLLPLDIVPSDPKTVVSSSRPHIPLTTTDEGCIKVTSICLIQSIFETRVLKAIGKRFQPVVSDWVLGCSTRHRRTGCRFRRPTGRRRFRVPFL